VISRALARQPTCHYYTDAPSRPLSRPPISMWEQQAAVARLREQGRAEVDEQALFAMVAQMREITDTAAASTRKARRDRERRTTPARSSVAAALTPPPPPSSGEASVMAEPFAVIDH